MLRTRPFLAFALAFFMLLPLMSASQAREMVSVKKRVNMRSGAGTQHEAVFLLEAGYPLSVIGRRGSWLKVRDYEGDVGWVYRPLTNKQRHYIVKVDVANIRKAPGTRARILGKATYGDVLRTVQRKGGWVKVRLQNGSTGWIAQRLLWGW